MYLFCNFHDEFICIDRDIINHFRGLIHDSADDFWIALPVVTEGMKVRTIELTISSWISLADSAMCEIPDLIHFFPRATRASEKYCLSNVNNWFKRIKFMVIKGPHLRSVKVRESNVFYSALFELLFNNHSSFTEGDDSVFEADILECKVNNEELRQFMTDNKTGVFRRLNS